MIFFFKLKISLSILIRDLFEKLKKELSDKFF
jgi:hypothetical protein